MFDKYMHIEEAKKVKKMVLASWILLPIAFVISIIVIACYVGIIVNIAEKNTSGEDTTSLAIGGVIGMVISVFILFGSSIALLVLKILILIKISKIKNYLEFEVRNNQVPSSMDMAILNTASTSFILLILWLIGIPFTGIFARVSATKIANHMISKDSILGTEPKLN